MHEPRREEIYEHARALDIGGRSAMSKEELARAVVDARRPSGPTTPSGGWVHDHLLTIILASLFLASLAGQLFYQYRHVVDEALQHGESAPALGSSEFMNAFLSSVLENWQSEFLQLATFVVLAAYFIHRNSPQSRDGSDEMQSDIKAIKAKLGA